LGLNPSDRPIRRTIEVDGERFECLELTPEHLLGRFLHGPEIRYAAMRLYAAGRIPIPLPAPRVSVIGTRNPTPKGIELARRLVEELVREKAIVVSGLARGIDTVAHRTAIERGGRTVAVLGTPINAFYPPENRSLQLKLMRKHMVVSQFPLGSPVTRGNFPMRNRTMALISDATVIVEAGERSGTIYQGWECIRLKRPLLIHASLKDLIWVGKMVEHGAHLFETADEVLNVLRRADSRTYSASTNSLKLLCWYGRIFSSGSLKASSMTSSGTGSKYEWNLSRASTSSAST
jgi:DNA processing protein